MNTVNTKSMATTKRANTGASTNKRVSTKEKYKGVGPQQGAPTPIPVFNLTFKNSQGLSTISIPDDQIHQMARAIHHFFLERNLGSVINFSKNGEQNQSPTTGS